MEEIEKEREAEGKWENEIKRGKKYKKKRDTKKEEGLERRDDFLVLLCHEGLYFWHFGRHKIRQNSFLTMTDTYLSFRHMISSMSSPGQVQWPGHLSRSQSTSRYGL